MKADFSLGLVEVSGLGHAIIMLDDMLKAGDVEFVATERKLGGRLVTIVVSGELSSVKASVDAGVNRAKQCGDGIYKASQVIARPHPEIYPFLHLNEEDDAPKVNSEAAGAILGEIGGHRDQITGELIKKPAAKKPVRRTTRKKTPPKDK